MDKRTLSAYLQQKNSTKRIFVLMKSVVDALNEENFQKSMQALDQLGEELIWLIDHHEQYLSFDNHQEKKQVTVVWLESYLQKINLKLLLANPLALCVLEEVWRDDYLQHRRSLKAKAGLTFSVRRRINIALRALSLCVRLDKKIKYNEPLIRQYDDKARNAIKTYSTFWQKCIDLVGVSVAFLMSLVCAATAASTVMWVLGGLISSGMLALVTGVISVAIMSTNWLIYRNAVPQLLQDIFGKDELFSGWKIYYDKQTGLREQLSLKQMLLLLACAFFSFSVGASSAALVYAYLSKLAIFSNLCLMMAAVYCVSVTALMQNSFVDWVRTGNAIYYISRSLNDIKEKFQNQKNKELKIILIYMCLTVMTGVSLFGLIALQMQSCASLTVLLMQYTTLMSSGAFYLSAVTSMGFALIGQLPFVLASCFGAVTALSQLVVTPKSEQVGKSNHFYGAIMYALFAITAAGSGAVVFNAFQQKICSWLGSAGAAWNMLSGVISAESNLIDRIESQQAMKMRMSNIARLNGHLAVASGHSERTSIRRATTSEDKVSHQGNRYYQRFFKVKQSNEWLLRKLTPHRSRNLSM